MSESSTCALCKRASALQESHIAPRFYFQRMRREGGGRYRRPTHPNKVEQDGPKTELLCADCEQKFSRREDMFAREFFHPWMDSRAHADRYTPDTHYFLVSLLWRRLVLYLRNPAPEAGPWIERLQEVEEDWRQYLNEERSAPSCDEIHLMLLDVLPTAPQPIENLNRYIVGTVDLTVGANAEACFVYAKMGLFLVLGWIEGFKPGLYTNTRVACADGPFQTPQKIEDGRIGAFLTDRARGSHELFQAGVSDTQREAIARHSAKNAEALLGGIHGRAFLADLAAEIDPMMGRSSKIGRNDICPCGSGRKYKRCHGA